MAGLKTYWQSGVRHEPRCSWLLLAGFGLLFLGVPPAPGRAQDAPARLINVASLTLVPLPNQSIAGIKGSGLQGPGIGNTASPTGTITLWDELKPPAQPQNAINGVSTITINGAVK